MHTLTMLSVCASVALPRLRNQLSHAYNESRQSLCAARLAACSHSSVASSLPRSCQHRTKAVYIRPTLIPGRARAILLSADMDRRNRMHVKTQLSEPLLLCVVHQSRPTSLQRRKRNPKPETLKRKPPKP